jgi:hypothetical protein
MQFTSQQEQQEQEQQQQPPQSMQFTSQRGQQAQNMYFAIGHGVSNKSILTNNTDVILIKKERCGFLSS